MPKKTANTEKFTESNDFPEPDKETKTIQYKLNNIHDFAWFADKRFVVRKSKVTLPNSGRNVDTYVYFRPSQAQWWKDAVTYVDSSVYYYSLWVGDYPYDMCTALDGALSAGGGMEYPTITIINETKDAKMLDEVIAHEVGHNWFYGILGSNERDHAWMDEGINSYYEARYMKARYPKKETDNETSLSTNGKGISLNLSQDLIMNSGIGLQSNRGKNQALDLTSAYFSSINYGILVYKKTAMSLDYLAQLMGQEKFDKTMQRYYEQWEFKHPYPEDLKQVFNSETGKDYSCFFNDLFESSQPLDYKMSGIKKTGNNAYQLSIVNKSVAKAPLELTGLNKNNEIVYTKLIDGFEGKKTVDIATSDKVQRFEINHKTPILDPFLSNNTIYTQKLFKKVEPIKLNLGISIPSANKTNINLLPAIGYNVYDGFMLGMAVYNSIIDLKNTEYFIAPMYGFESKKLTGVAMINQYFYPKEQNGSFLKIGVSGKKFSSFQSNFTDRDSVSYNSILGYIRVVPAIEYVFKRNNEKPYIQQRIALRSVMRWLDGNHFSDSGIYLGIEQKMSTIQQFTYTRKNVSVLNPWSIEADMQQGKKENAGIFVRASLEAKFRVNYNAKNKFFEARAFGGGFLYPDFSNLRTSDADLRIFNYSGQDDYLYDGMYIGRNESTGFWSRQVMIRDGGMKLSIPQLGSSSQPGRNNQWLLATNLSSTLPSKIPFRVFVDAGIFPDTNSQLTYVGGLSLPLINDQVQVFFPLIMSDNLKLDVNGNQSKWAQRISFTLNIHNLNIYKILREIDI